MHFESMYFGSMHFGSMYFGSMYFEMKSELLQMKVSHLSGAV